MIFQTKSHSEFENKFKNKIIQKDNNDFFYKNIRKSTFYKKYYLDRNIKIMNSKKNMVFLIKIDGKSRILKSFEPDVKKRMNVESSILKKGSPVLSIPTLYEIDYFNNFLIMQYIKGKNLCDIINSKDTSFDRKLKILILLAKWFLEFHEYFKTQKKFLLRGDSNLRNFLYDNQIWGVDFEESRFGEPIEDIACMCSSILSTDPMFTKEKFLLCNTFVESYSEKINMKIEKLNRMISLRLMQKIQWRSKDFQILKRYANIIRKRGLLHKN